MGKKLRKAVQAAWGILCNGYVKGFLPGETIYQGPLKHFCVPGMNCYSCPGALGACPIGAMQAVFSGRRRKIAFSVVGFLAAVGLLAGRFVCGWLCLFGLVQELLYKIPVPKLRVPKTADRILRFLKYGMLMLFVFALPFFFRTEYGLGEPFFCKYICPVGTLEGGVPLVLLNAGMRQVLGGLFRWKFLLLILCVLASVFIHRPFCKYVCPLGAFYGLFQKVSLLRLHYDEHACIHCGKCAAGCKMQVDPCSSPNSAECIRCGECVQACPAKALMFGMGNSKKKGKTAHGVYKEKL
ncbi:MAG: 4Fe-4S binding protein [Lachnospiraceae bacterium]|nr:4Fe-4S binding protein [Lachnospiraceae bacterium]